MVSEAKWKERWAGLLGPSHFGVCVHPIDEIVHLRVLFLPVALIGLQD